MISVSQDVKNAYNQSTTQTDKIILNGKEYKINNVEYIDDTYLDGNIFGTAIAKQLSFEIEACNIEKQEFEYLTGIKVNGVIQWISLGNFITQDVQESDTIGMIKVEAMDYMLKTNIVYKSLLHYSDGTVTLYDVLQEACSIAGLNLGTLSITNGNFIVDSNQFEEGTLVRQVIQAVAQMSGTVAKIKQNNSLYLINPNQVNSVSKVFNTHDYYNIDIKRYTRPINTLILGMKDVEGENVALRDETSVAQYGENKIVFNDNPFAYTEEKRTQLITALFNAIKGFEYKSYEIKGQSYPYMETLDKIQFKDKNENTYNSYIFRFNYKSPNGLESTTEAPSITDATVKYENIMGAEEIAKRTELIVDKQNQKITSVIENVGVQDQKIARVTQTVDELNSKISDIADITTSLESNSAKLEFTDINQSEPIRVVIHPLGINIAKLHPHTGLKPRVGLKLTTRTIRFTNTKTDEVFEYEIPADLLYYDNENYDEFILDYDSQTCIINKKCKWNNDGSVGLLSSGVTRKYTYPKIELTDGDYTVQLIQYNAGYLFVRLMAQNIYTTQFATKAEVNSDIRQTVDNINLSVNEKLTNYSTTTEMNSAIDLKANEITSSVSQNYATKSELSSAETSLNSKIDQTAESISLTVDSVEEKVETAQSTANTATTKADNAQTSANSAQSTANSATTKANNAQTTANNAQKTADNINTNLTTNYYTKTQTNSAINQKADSITSTVSKTYSTKTETTQAKNDAINSANTSTDNKLKSYSTTTQMNSAIEQKANSIISTVSETYSTKTEINDAINNIEIGGRNLLLGSSAYQTGTPYSLKPASDDTYIRLPSTRASVTKGKTYYLQCNTDGLWSKHKDVGNRYCTIWIVSASSENEQKISVNQVFEGNKQETGRKTWKWVSNITGTIGIRLNVYGEGNATVKFWNLKLEEGTKPTDWTAPDEDYSTTVQMNSAITQKANEITSTVSETYSTKTETTQAKNDAINSANTSTDNKLKSYSTTTQMNSAITQKANEINLEVSKKVGNDEIISKINQSSESITINANHISLARKDNKFNE